MRAPFGSTIAFVAMAACFAAPAGAQNKGAATGAQSQGATIGAQVIDIPADYRQRTGYAAGGVFVVAVVPDSPAERARILPGDVLTSFSGTALASPAQFFALAAAAGIGTPATVAALRYGRALTFAVSPVELDQLYAKPPTCREADANELTADSIAAGRRHDTASELAAAERAFDLYESCAAANDQLDEHILLKAGDSLLLQAAARAAAGDRAGALPFAQNAAAIYRLATRSSVVSDANKTIAQGKIGAIERAFPDVNGAAPDGSIAIGLGRLSDAQAESPFAVLASWTAPADDTYTMLHVRIDLHPAYEAHFFAQGFKVTITSRYIGPQAVYAMDEPAPPAANSILRPKSDLDAREDFRLLRRADLAPGESKVLVLSFLVPSDAEFSNAAATITYAPR